MKKALLGILLAGLLSLPLFAGPTIGVGGAWVDGEVWIAPSLGTVLLTDVGVTAEVYFAGFNTDPGWEIGAQTLFLLTMNVDLPSAESVEWYGILGVGAPAIIGIDTGGFAFEGGDFGVVAGIGARQVGSGIGFKGMVYVNEAFVGVGVATYLDFFTLANLISDKTE